jgi:hypothetical protein
MTVYAVLKRAFKLQVDIFKSFCNMPLLNNAYFSFTVKLLWKFSLNTRISRTSLPYLQTAEIDPC